jgi:hypothetical protein
VQWSLADGSLTWAVGLVDRDEMKTKGIPSTEAFVKSQALGDYKELLSKMGAF